MHFLQATSPNSEYSLNQMGDLQQGTPHRSDDILFTQINTFQLLLFKFTIRRVIVSNWIPEHYGI